VLRYKLRTLLILLAVVPPVLAGIAWLAGLGSAGPLALAVAVYVVLALVLVGVSKSVEAIAPRRPTGVCSFCHISTGPLAEGPNNVLICRDCAVSCLKLIDDQLRLREDDAPRKTDTQCKTSWPSDSKSNPVKAK
jgi:hypothetical protein